MLRSTMLCWNPAHVATRRCRNSSVSWIGTRYKALATSKLNCTDLIFVDPGAIINGQCYRDVLLMQKLLPAIRSIAGDVFVFQRDNAPAHRARDTFELLHCIQTLHRSVLTCGQRTVLTSTRVITTSGAWCKCIEYQSAIRTSYRSVLLRHGLNFSTAWWTMQLISGEKDWKCVSVQKVHGHFEHLLWRCLPNIPVATHHNRFFSEPPMPTHNRLFPKPPTFWGMQHCLQSDEKVLHCTR